MGIWGSKVVAVDDDLDTLDLVRAVLACAGRPRGRRCSAPGEALSTVIGVMPDVLLVDIAMPRRGRAHAHPQGAHPLAGEGRAHSRRDAHRVPVPRRSAWPSGGAPGFQRHVPKPFAPDDLVAIVDELAGRVVERRTNTLAPVILPARRPPRAAPRVARRAAC